MLKLLLPSPEPVPLGRLQACEVRCLHPGVAAPGALDREVLCALAVQQAAHIFCIARSMPAATRQGSSLPKACVVPND
jgi:hypothetical protein